MNKRSKRARFYASLRYDRAILRSLTQAAQRERDRALLDPYVATPDEPELDIWVPNHYGRRHGG